MKLQRSGEIRSAFWRISTPTSHCCVDEREGGRYNVDKRIGDLSRERLDRLTQAPQPYMCHQNSSRDRRIRTSLRIPIWFGHTTQAELLISG